jgi:hypothetical protein
MIAAACGLLYKAEKHSTKCYCPSVNALGLLKIAHYTAFRFVYCLSDFIYENWKKRAFNMLLDTLTEDVLNHFGLSSV